MQTPNFVVYSVPVIAFASPIFLIIELIQLVMCERLVGVKQDQARDRSTHGGTSRAYCRGVDLGPHRLLALDGDDVGPSVGPSTRHRADRRFNHRLCDAAQCRPEVDSGNFDLRRSNSDRNAHRADGADVAHYPLIRPSAI